MPITEKIEHILHTSAWAIVQLAELAAVFIIAVAILQALWRVLKILIGQIQIHTSKENLRLDLGRWLAISLEFLLAADIIMTAIAPSWEEIGKLAAITLIRTALNYFLQKEIEANEKRMEKVAEA